MNNNFFDDPDNYEVNFDGLDINESLAVDIVARIEVPPNKANFSIKLKEGYNAISLIKEYCDKIGAKIDWKADPAKNRIGFACQTIINDRAVSVGEAKSKQEAKTNSSMNAIQYLMEKGPKERDHFKSSVLIIQNNPPPQKFQPQPKNVKMPEKTQNPPKEQEEKKTIYIPPPIRTAPPNPIPENVNNISSETTLSNFQNKTQISQAFSQATTVKVRSNSMSSGVFKLKEMFESLNLPPMVEVSKKSQEDDLKKDLELLYLKELKPESVDLKSLESSVDQIFQIFEQFTEEIDKKYIKLIPTGSYLTNSLRKNRLDVDFCLVHNENIWKVMDYWCDFIKNSGFDATTLYDINDLSFVKVYRENDKNQEFSFNFYDYNLSDDWSKRMFTRTLNLNMEYVKFLSYDQNENLKILRLVLKNWASTLPKICNGEFVDLIIYNVTKKFEKIDLIPNIKSFFEFLALGGTSKAMNSWIWHGFPDKFAGNYEDFFGKAGRELEFYAKTIVKNGDLKFLTKALK